MSALQVLAAEPRQELIGETLPERALVRIGKQPFRHARFRGSDEVAFSPDGKTLAVACLHNLQHCVRIFRVETGEEIRRISIDDRVQGIPFGAKIAISPNGMQLVCGQRDGHITLVDLKTGATLFRQKRHQDDIADLAFSPDGKWFMTAGQDSLIELWTTDKLPELVCSMSHGGPRQLSNFAEGGKKNEIISGVGISAVAFSPDGRTLVAIDAGKGTVAAWSVPEAKLLQFIIPASEIVNFNIHSRKNAVALLNDGKQILSVSQQRVPREKSKTAGDSKYSGITQMRLWNLETGRQVREWHRDGDHEEGSVAFSLNRQQVAIAGEGKTTVHDALTGEIVHEFSTSGFPGGRPVFSPDGKLLAIPLVGGIALFDLQSGKRRLHDEATPDGDITSAVWSKSGSEIVTVQTDGLVRRWDAVSGKLLWHAEFAPPLAPHSQRGEPRSVALSSDGQLLLAAGIRASDDNQTGTVRVFDMPAGAVRHDIHTPRGFQSIAISPDGASAVVGNSEYRSKVIRLSVIDTTTGKIRFTFPPEQEKFGMGGIRALQFVDDSSAFKVVTEARKLIHVDAYSGQVQKETIIESLDADDPRRKNPNRPGLSSCPFSANRQWVATSSEELLTIWESDTEKRLRQISIPRLHRRRICLSDDLEWLAAADGYIHDDWGNNQIHLYNVRTGKEILTFETPERAGLLVFSPDGTRLLTGLGGSAIVWDVRLP